MTEDKGPVVLLVDDNPSKRYSVGRWLRAAGFELIEAASGQEALDAALSGPDAIVLDVNLPDIDGYEVCRRLRDRESSSRTPIVHLSATFVDSADKVLGLEAGADGYLTHPVEPPVLVATLRAFLRARKAEEDMRQSQARFRAIFDRAPSGIAMLDDDLRYLDANPAMAKMLGSSNQDLVGRRWDESVMPSSSDGAQRIASALRRGGDAGGVVEIRRGNGENAYLEWALSRHSSPGVWLACATDVTERRQAEAERERLLASERAARGESERANRLKDEFLATVSHELRSPLQVIVGWAQLLASRRPTKIDDYHEGVKAIDRNARIQTRLVADLLDLSRITSGKLHLDRKSLLATQVLGQATEGLGTQAQAKGVHLSVDAEAAGAHIGADPDRMHQVLANLLNNAIKFTPEGGTVKASTHVDGEWVEFRIRDDGAGISPEFLPHIFEHFRQQDAANTRQHQGLGLGLSIVKRLVELQGGSVQAQSAGHGHGATFIVRMPRLQPATGESSPVDASEHVDNQAPVARSGVLAGLRVLVVDDDDDARLFVIRLLQDHGVTVAQADGVAEGWRLVQEFDPQLLISDISMPGDDGYELIRRIRSGGYSAERLPAVALTAFAHHEDRVRVHAAGFQLHLSKPIELESLLSALTGLMSRGTAAS